MCADNKKEKEWMGENQLPVCGGQKGTGRAQAKQSSGRAGCTAKTKSPEDHSIGCRWRRGTAGPVPMLTEALP